MNIYYAIVTPVQIDFDHFECGALSVPVYKCNKIIKKTQFHLYSLLPTKSSKYQLNL